MAMFLVGVAGSLIAAEVYMWLPGLAARLIRYEASRLPRASERMLEEWTAHLDSIQPHIKKVSFAVSLILKHWWLIGELPEDADSADANVVSGNIVIEIPLGALSVQGQGVVTAVGRASGTGLLSANVGEVLHLQDDLRRRNHPAYLPTTGDPIYPFPPYSPAKSEPKDG